MRAAILTTALVLATLVVWSSVREAERNRPASAPATLEAPPSERPLPDVAAAPRDARDGAAGPRRPEAEEATPIYRPATTESPVEHVVVPGETLETIAERYYGDATRAGELYAANRDRIRDPARLHTGQTLVIP